MDARLDNGYRVNGVLKNVALNGPILTIRKFTNDEITLDDLVNNGTMDTQIPIFSIKSQIANAIDIFVHLRRDSDGKRRLIEVAEMVGFDGENYMLNYIYYTDSDGKLIDTGNKLINRTKLVQNEFEEGE